ncbi:menaquinone biosynthetic enzyme MqnA/MqnD family protein [Paenibacillus tarimensis]|uniref:menaquinone biosynthetic enzyme MqnA/MqnD family protein n=1 Tax=Paenibacillus tarimensis TaxID=416012 RepID=UPI001F2D5071|nr:menaquinone biosynthesis protein [Paenibacillus tarimensis]MCF2942546.1 menaquinone biosynthesis protein [Paenibacillus tarimensis]
MGLKRPITIGRIDYANVWPIYDYLNEVLAEMDAPPLKFMQAVPSVLNKALGEGRIDAAAVSSFAYARHSSELLLLPGLSVSADGPVGSILLFYKEPFDRMLSGRIALTTTSETSINLLKIVLEQRYQAKPEYLSMEPDLEAMMEVADAALLIGDHAIRASWLEHGYRVLDVGEMWKKWTGHSMTYAVVAVRRSVAESYPQEVGLLHRALLESKRRGIRYAGELARKAAAEIGGDLSYWNQYFHGLSHDFGTAEQTGLMHYFGFAKQLGLLSQDVGIRYWSESVAQVNE